MSFNYAGFQFSILSTRTCGLKGLTPFSSILEGFIIPSVAINEDDGMKYKVTQLLEKCLYNSGVTSISIPRTIKKIGSNILCHASITNMIIPNSVEELGNACFSTMKSLQIVTFETGSRLKIIGNTCFFFFF